MARILVIEDNPANLELMTYLLKAFGHVTFTADDGDHGMELARRERPDLVVCDVHLPGTDGYAVVKMLKSDSELKGIPVVAVTALAMVGDRDKGLASGFDGYISKPIEPEMFVAQVEHFLSAGQRGSVPNRERGQDAAKTSPRGPKKATILVVDDSTTNRELIYQTLTPFGFEVQMFPDVQTAFAHARTAIPDLILSDLHMPGDDGFSLVRQVKAEAKLAGVPFVFISSSVWGEKDRTAALRLGVTRFLVRPIEPSMLIEEISACLANRPSVSHG